MRGRISRMSHRSSLPRFAATANPVGLVGSLLRNGTRCLAFYSKAAASQRQPSGIRHMLRVNYLAPEQMPTHQRDFPRNDQVVEMPRTDGSHQLALLVIMYLLALL